MVYHLSSAAWGLSALAACARAANFPAIPSDKTTPVQQRIAVNGANCKYGRCNTGYQSSNTG